MVRLVTLLARTPRHSEATLEGLFRAEVRRSGGMAIKLAPMEAGIPDRLVISPDGTMYLVELKTETGRLRPIQKVVHDRLTKMGVPVVVLAGRDAIVAWIADHIPSRSR